MGWYGANQSVMDMLSELVSPSHVLKHHRVGEELWTLELHNGKKCICLYLIASDGLESRYKPMDEGMHPFYYGCPLEFLDEAPERCPEWRAEARAYHADRASRR